MICNCGKQSRRLQFINNKWYCHECLGLSESGGTSTRGTLTRMRVRDQAYKHEGDFIPPHTIDKFSKKIKVNDDFVKKYGVKAKEYYNDQDMKEYPKLKTAIKKHEKTVDKYKQDLRKDITFSGDEKKGFKGLING